MLEVQVQTSNSSLVFTDGFLCVYLFISVLQTVSYAQFLLPTNALVRQKSNVPLDTSTVQTPMSRNWINSQKNSCHQRFCSTVGQEAGVLLRRWNNMATTFTVVIIWHILHIVFVSSTGADELSDYDPNLLSDPQWPCGKHKRVLIFGSYVVSFFILEHQHMSDVLKAYYLIVSMYNLWVQRAQ